MQLKALPGTFHRREASASRAFTQSTRASESAEGLGSPAG